MEAGNIVEYIDRQKITCAVILEIKKQRLRLLTENNREVNLSARRLLHAGDRRLDLSMGRDRMVNTLKALAEKRNALIDNVAVKDLWEVLNTEQELIDPATMTEFCFPDNPSADHVSAVIRAFFRDRLYFKFNPDGFYPHSRLQVEQLVARQKEAALKSKIVEEGGSWLKTVLNHRGLVSAEPLPDEVQQFVDILKSFYLYEKESESYDLARGMLAKAGLDGTEGVFQVLVKLGVFDADENIDLLRHEIPVDFSEPILAHAEALVRLHPVPAADSTRRDLSGLPTMTIDGQGTLDFDDALSIEEQADGFRLGVHIVDVGHFVSKEDPIDREARVRASSIYMPDQKISMLPPLLGEELCSLRAGELRPAISTMINLTAAGDILDYEIFPSLIRVKQQLTYYDVNLAADENHQILILRKIAEAFRRKRLDAGGLQIVVPEIIVWLAENREVEVNRINRESPGRMLVSEIMIMANWMMARFLAARHLPAVFRSQPPPRERLYKGADGTLFQNWMQRKLLSRFVLGTTPEWHSGLGLDAYVTATSPIRKYFDLVTQRQIRAALGLEKPYDSREIEKIIQALELPMSRVGRIQTARQRYWLLKYLEKRIGEKEEAIVLYKKRTRYQILLTQYMLECDLPASSGIDLKPEDLIQVTIQHVSAKSQVLAVFMG